LNLIDVNCIAEALVTTIRQSRKIDSRNWRSEKRYQKVPIGGD